MGTNRVKASENCECDGYVIYRCRKEAYRRGSDSHVVSYTTRRVKRGVCRCEECEHFAYIVDDWLGESPESAPQAEGTYRAHFSGGSPDYWGSYDDAELEFIEVSDAERKFWFK